MDRTQSSSHVVQWGILLSSVIVKRNWKVCVSGHTSALGCSTKCGRCKTVDFADVLGAIAENHHLTSMCSGMFYKYRRDRDERHDHETIDEVLGDQDMEEGGEVWNEADREADLLEHLVDPAAKKVEGALQKPRVQAHV